MADINLIPQEEKREQAKVKAVKSSTYVSIVIFLIVGAIGGYIFFQTTSVNNRIKATEKSIQSLRADVRDLESIEISARNLGMRYSTLRDILNTRTHYSLLMQEFSVRIPGAIELTTFGVGKGDTINVSGTGSDYISIARFINNLLDDEFLGGNENLQKVFTGVSLNSVNLDAQTNNAKFFIVVTVDTRLLTK